MSAAGLARALVCAAGVSLAAGVLAQGTQLWVSNGAVRLRVAAVGLIAGEVLQQLRDGRSVKVDATLDVLTRPSGPAVGRASQTCTFSFDLWEEKFAVSVAAPIARSISHLRVDDAEAWCIDQLVVPLSELGNDVWTRPFWITLEVTAAARSVTVPPENDNTLSLQWLIDTLSRRRRESVSRRTIEAGPLRLSP